MKKRILYILATLCILFNAGLSAHITLPEEFYVKQKWLSLTLAFDISCKEYNIGTLYRKFWSLRTEYDFYDVNEVLQAKATSRLLTLGYIFDVVDAANGEIGRVEERLLTFLPTCDIFSAYNEKIAIAKMNFWGTKFTLKDPVTSNEIATISRPYFRLKDNWTCRITNPALFALKQIDPRLFVTVMAFQTDRDISNAAHSYGQIKLNFDAIKMDVEKYQITHDPKEEDFQAIADLVDTLAGEEFTLEEDEAEEFLKKMEILHSLIISDALPSTQKNAAAIILREKL